MPVLCQYLRVWELLRGVSLDPLLSDRFVWKWSPDGKYSVSSAYRAFFFGATELRGAKELWRSKALPRVKFFFWLAIHRRLWTAERRWRHGLQDDSACVLCAQEPETIDHLLIGCMVARQLWFALLTALGLQSLAPADSMDVVDWWLTSRAEVTADSRPVLDSVVLLISWCIWKERDNRTFNRVTADLHGMIVLSFTRERTGLLAALLLSAGPSHRGRKFVSQCNIELKIQ